MRSKLAMALLILLLLTAGCDRSTPVGVTVDGQPADPVAPEPVREVVLPYSRAESLDPIHTGNRMNLELCALIYDPLVRLDGAFCPQPALAERVEVAGNTVTLHLRAEVYFHNGKRFSAEDVLYSLEAARQAGNYTARLAELEQIEVLDGQTVRLTLSRENGLFAALLQIPMLPARTAGEPFEPVGTGRYILYAAQGLLQANAGWYGGAQPLSEIHLFDTPDAEAAGFAFELGSIGLLTQPPAETAGLRKGYVTNRLVFLGVNPKAAALHSAPLRQALSSGLSRSALLGENLMKGGYAVLSPLNPRWYLFDATAAGRHSALEPEALLQAAGYGELDGEGLRVAALPGGRTQRLSVRLLCNSAVSGRVGLAAGIAGQLRACGYEVLVREVGAAEYFSLVEKGDFDLYIGELRLLPDMDLSALVGSGGRLNYGGFSSADVDGALLALRLADEAGRPEAASRLAAALDDELPIIPLYYEEGEVLVAEALAPMLEPNCTDPLNGLTEVPLRRSEP
ncbi:MAG: hypothetical protein GXX99_04090 [Clostridiales bacterium]|nr:hypothetical protein [Clostridiales bacterium]